MTETLRTKIQRFGGYLTRMVMPNIGAFIAWGILTALFMPKGWFPNETLDAMRPIMLNYMLPTLIAYTGGSIVHGVRGGVIAVIGTFGVIASTGVPMFIGAMIIAPFSGWVLKKFDTIIKGKVKSGFEMIVNNFSLGIIGILIAIVANYAFGPLFEVLNNFFASCVEVLVEHKLLFALPIITEPARMLFLNNAISQGIMNPLGTQAAAEFGKSIYFLLTSNPGPGVGMLLAYWRFGRGTAKTNAPSAAIIVMFGGIHELYFPYVLMKPVLIVSTMVGWMCSNLFYNLVGAGLVAYPSPGSIISYMLMTPMGSHFTIILGVLIGLSVSFLLASIILKMDKKEYSAEDLGASTERMKKLKGTARAASGAVNLKAVDTIIFACDAGMGSSAMGAALLQDKLKEAGIAAEVVHKAVDEVPADAQVIVCHESLKSRAYQLAPHAYYVTISNFLNAPEYDTLVAVLKENTAVKQ